MKPTPLVLVLALATGCGDSPPGIDATPYWDAPADAAVPDARGDAPVDAVANPCPLGSLCLVVNPVDPGATIPDGRLIVLYHQVLENVTPYPMPQVGLDLPFSGTSTSIEIDLLAIPLPVPRDDYRLCARTCFDLNNPACDCYPSQPEITLAQVFVMRDPDTSGAIEPAELDAINRYGAGYVQLGLADSAHAVPNVLDQLLPDGILSGMHAYVVVMPGEHVDELRYPPFGLRFELDVCVPGDASCDLVRIPDFN